MAISGEQPHPAPSLILDLRHPQTDPFSPKLCFITSAFPKESFIRGSQPAPINRIYLPAKKQATRCSVPPRAILNQLQKHCCKDPPDRQWYKRDQVVSRVSACSNASEQHSYILCVLLWESTGSELGPAVPFPQEQYSRTA